ncbi:pyridoxamine 5'-phosphate oxidase family protein [Streptomyces lasalocidi]
MTTDPVRRARRPQRRHEVRRKAVEGEQGAEQGDDRALRRRQRSIRANSAFSAVTCISWTAYGRSSGSPRRSSPTRRTAVSASSRCVSSRTVRSSASPRPTRPGSSTSVPRVIHAAAVRVLDPWTLVLPDRPGNKLADTAENLTRHPGVGLVFLVPGLREVLRVNGDAFLSDDPELETNSRGRGWHFCRKIPDPKPTRS